MPNYDSTIVRFTPKNRLKKTQKGIVEFRGAERLAVYRRVGTVSRKETTAFSRYVVRAGRYDAEWICDIG